MWTMATECIITTALNTCHAPLYEVTLSSSILGTRWSWHNIIYGCHHDGKPTKVKKYYYFYTTLKMYSKGKYWVGKAIVIPTQGRVG